MQIFVQSFLNSARILTIEIEPFDSIESLKAKIQDEDGISTDLMKLYFNGELLEEGRTLSDYNIQAGAYIKTSNTISTLATKEEKQQAKLQLAALDRSASNRLSNYDLSELPTYYSGNTAVNNPNTGGLITGRPWAVNTVITAGLVMSIDSALIPVGTTLKDQTANNNDATLVGATWTKANYFELDGVDDYIRSPNLYSNIGNPDTFTAEVWVYPSDYGVVLSVTNTPTPSTSYHYSALEFTNSGGKPLPEFGIWNGTGITSDSGTALEFDAWYNMAITYNASTNTMKGYINGSQVATANVNYDSPHDDGETAHYLLFGAGDSTNMGDGTYFDGRLGDIRVYNAELSAAQITTNYNNTKVKYGL
jgi:hypothetical protein